MLLPVNGVKMLLNYCTLKYIPKLFDVASCVLLAVKKIQIAKTFKNAAQSRLIFTVSRDDNQVIKELFSIGKSELVI